MTRVEEIREKLGERGEVRLRVFGGSMVPWIRPGDVLLIRRVDGRQIGAGNVVLFAREDRLFVHRVIGKRAGGELVTKGDALPRADAPVTTEELLGRVTFILRGTRQISLETPRQIALGRLLSRLSFSSRLWYPLARVTKRMFLPGRKFFGPAAPPSSQAPPHDTV